MVKERQNRRSLNQLKKGKRQRNAIETKRQCNNRKYERGSTTMEESRLKGKALLFLPSLERRQSS